MLNLGFKLLIPFVTSDKSIKKATAQLCDAYKILPKFSRMTNTMSKSLSKNFIFESQWMMTMRRSMKWSKH